MGREPVSIIGLVTTALSQSLNVLVLLGVVDWTTEQLAALNALGGTLILLGGILYARAKSTPADDPVIPATGNARIDGVPVTVAPVVGQPGTSTTTLRDLGRRR